MSDRGSIHAIDQGHPEESQQSTDSDSELNRGVNAQRMPMSRQKSRQGQAAKAQTSHKGREQHAQGNGARADDQLQQLIPDDLVDPLAKKSATRSGRNGLGSRTSSGGAGSVAFRARTVVSLIFDARS